MPFVSPDPDKPELQFYHIAQEIVLKFPNRAVIFRQLQNQKSKSLLNIFDRSIPGTIPAPQFLKLCIGAGIRPVRLMNASQEKELTGMIGA